VELGDLMSLEVDGDVDLWRKCCQDKGTEGFP